MRTTARSKLGSAGSSMTASARSVTGEKHNTATSPGKVRATCTKNSTPEGPKAALLAPPAPPACSPQVFFSSPHCSLASVRRPPKPSVPWKSVPSVSGGEASPNGHRLPTYTGTSDRFAACRIKRVFAAVTRASQWQPKVEATPSTSKRSLVNAQSRPAASSTPTSAMMATFCLVPKPESEAKTAPCTVRSTTNNANARRHVATVAGRYVGIEISGV
mmetsp:Transcript_112719/g.318557  ORF Transcript_112719/g.318557 Transcript_112719/m.318557 type:complete len:217 (+) Transcript_112719:618-1268(+)